MQTTTFLTMLCSALLTSACVDHTLDDMTPTLPSTPEPDPGPSPDPTVPDDDNFVRWMKCMTLADFREAEMVKEWNKTRAENETLCEACHENGAEGFILTKREQKFFDVIKTNKYYALQYFAYSPLSAFDVQENQIAMNGVSQGFDPHREHPRFNPIQGLAASSYFASLTQARFVASGGNCP